MENNMINDQKLEEVTGGYAYANGSFVNYGSYIVYTVVQGDVLGGIGNVLLSESISIDDDFIGRRLICSPPFFRIFFID